MGFRIRLRLRFRIRFRLRFRIRNRLIGIIQRWQFEAKEFFTVKESAEYRLALGTRRCIGYHEIIAGAHQLERIIIGVPFRFGDGINPVSRNGLSAIKNFPLAIAIFYSRCASVEKIAKTEVISIVAASLILYGVVAGTQDVMIIAVFIAHSVITYAAIKSVIAAAAIHQGLILAGSTQQVITGTTMQFIATGAAFQLVVTVVAKELIFFAIFFTGIQQIIACAAV